MGEVDQEGKIRPSHCNTACQREGPEGISVITVPSGDDSPSVVTKIILPRDRLGFRAPGKEVDLSQTFRQDFPQGFCVIFDRFGCKLSAMEIVHLAHLVNHGLENLFLPMADTGYQGASRSIDVAFAAFIEEIDPFSVGHQWISPSQLPIKDPTLRVAV
jgi:hypothetical protein